MATVFMKWLETSPEDYERGIQILTLGRQRKAAETIARGFSGPGQRVLEIGCGTGRLARLMAERGADVVAIDASQAMVEHAESSLDGRDFAGSLSLKHLDATLIDERFPPASFDLIVASLVFSELAEEVRSRVLTACAGLLKEGGRLIVFDEVVPARALRRLLYYAVHVPMTVLTWLLTRTTTSALRDFETSLREAGFRTRVLDTYLGGSLVLYQATPDDQPLGEAVGLVRRLEHRVSLHTVLIDAWSVLFRIIPPYPKAKSGLFAIGEPGPDSPVLVTGNFDLTVRRLLRRLDGKVDAWLLVADSAGINVWCAAGGGYFTAEKVIAAVKSSYLPELVNHKTLILPQLCANGVDGWRIREETGYEVEWGPIRAEDIPAYFAAGLEKDRDMRTVRFPLEDRLEMGTASLGFYGLFLIPLFLIFWRQLFWPFMASLIGLSYFYILVHPWLPGRDGLVKSVSLVLLSLGGLAVYAMVYTLSAPRFFNWAVGLTGLSIFTAGELQGMSPVMRGEQANWGWEAAAGVVLGLIYWLVPKALGWR